MSRPLRWRSVQSDGRPWRRAARRLIAYLVCVLAAAVSFALIFDLGPSLDLPSLSLVGYEVALASFGVLIVTVGPFILALRFEHRLAQPLAASCLGIGLVCAGVGDVLASALIGGADAGDPLAGLGATWLKLAPSMFCAGGMGGLVYGLIVQPPSRRPDPSPD